MRQKIIDHIVSMHHKDTVSYEPNGDCRLSHIAYYRVSTSDQSIEGQRAALGGSFDREFSDSGVSGATLAADRPGFASMLDYVREGDELHCYAIDRMGRDAIDIQQIVRALLAKGVVLHIHGIGIIAKGVGEIIVAVLAQLAAMERDRIRERCDAGRVAARASLASTGFTHRGKPSLGRPRVADPATVREWRRANTASISQTMEHFSISKATVVRACAS